MTDVPRSHENQGPCFCVCVSTCQAQSAATCAAVTIMVGAGVLHSGSSVWWYSMNINPPYPPSINVCIDSNRVWKAKHSSKGDKLWYDMHKMRYKTKQLLNKRMINRYTFDLHLFHNNFECWIPSHYSVPLNEDWTNPWFSFHWWSRDNQSCPISRHHCSLVPGQKTSPAPRPHPARAENKLRK